jgi:HK97 family phage prohead protease
VTQKQTSKVLSGLVGPERRFVTIQTETRADDDPDKLGFLGHAAVVGKRAYIGVKPYGFWETVRAGAFTKTIAEGDIRMLHNHDPNLLLARSTISEGPGRLLLGEDKKGLRTDADFVPTTFARDVHALVRSKALSQMSFGFTPVTEEWTRNDDGEDERVLVELRLADVSTVTFPAYTETDAAVRSAGLGFLMEAIELDDEQRLQVVQAMRVGSITPDLLPVLRAASRALAELADRTEPAEATRDDGSPDPLALATESIRRRMRVIASRSGDYSKGVTVR